MPTREPTPKVTAAASGADEQLAQAGEPPGAGGDRGTRSRRRRTGRSARGPATTASVVAPKTYGSTGMTAPDDERQERRAGGEPRVGQLARGHAELLARVHLERGLGVLGQLARPSRTASSRSTPRAHPDLARAPWPRPRGCAESSRRSFSNSCSASSDCEATEVYSPAAIENAPAARPARPASTTALRLPSARPAVPPATPAMRAKLETRPSMAPKTAGRSQPPVTSRWCSRGMLTGTNLPPHSEPASHAVRGRSAIRRRARLVPGLGARRDGAASSSASASEASASSSCGRSSASSAGASPRSSDGSSRPGRSRALTTM